MPPANPARPTAPRAATPLALLAALPTAPRPFAFLATAPTPLRVTARTRPLIDLFLTSRLDRATAETRPADFLRDPVPLVEGLAFEDFTPLLRFELVRELAVIEPALRAFLFDRLVPAGFVVV
jgi:hypothetical protein